MANTIFWVNVNNRLKELGVNQEIMCSEIGLSINTVRGWVSKDVLPRVDDGILIANFLHTSLEFLITGKEENQYKELLEKIVDIVEKSGLSIKPR